MSIEFKDGLGQNIKFDQDEVLEIKGSYFKVCVLCPHPLKIELQPANEDTAKKLFEEKNLSKPKLSGK